MPKTTADALQPYVRDAELAWEAWRSANFTAGPPPTGLAATQPRFTTPRNAAGIAYEGGYLFTAGPPPHWRLNTIYPKL